MFRFAILCRVSSEEQTRGESLAVQEKVLTRCVENLEGEIVKRYIGSESAMGVKERPILEELLADCPKGIFNAIMVYDLSRLTRDPLKSKIIFATIKKHNIRLYVQTQEFNLNNPETNLIAGIMAEINAFSVHLSTKKAMESRIELARRGYPASSYPHGRRLISTDKSKPAVYEVIPEYKQEAETFYDLYVNQAQSLKQIAEQFDTNTTYVRKVLSDYSSSEWKQVIRYENKNEIIITPVPPLLSDEQIAKSKAVAKTNKAFNRRIFPYLLGGRIKCELCKLTYSGQTCKSHTRYRRYYQHSYQFRTDLCVKTIQSDLIESAVFLVINDFFSSIDNLKQAITNALSANRNQEDELEKKIKTCQATFEKLEKGKDRLIQMVVKGVLTESEISKEITKIREETIETQQKLKSLTDQLQSLSLDVPEDLPERIHDFYLTLIGQEGSIVEDWSLEQKQTIIDWFFGKHHNRNTGVFVLRDPSLGVVFNVRGIFHSSYLGILDQAVAGARILGFQELDTKIISESVDFTQILQNLYG